MFEKIKTTDISTLNEIVDTVFPQISTSFTPKKMLALASGVTKYKLVGSEGFPFEKTDGINYPSAGDVVVAQGLAENVRELHEFLYPNETDWEVSEQVQSIANDIAYLTGVVRPAELDEEQSDETESEAEGDDEADNTTITSTTDNSTMGEETE